jgi:hypothetical protein
VNQDRARTAATSRRIAQIEFPITSDQQVFFFFNPFAEAVMRMVMRTSRAR